MPDREREPYSKGFFGRARLPVADRYPVRAGQRRMLQVGAVALALVFAAFVFDRVLIPGRLVSNGPLSVSHALFAEDCTTCHSPFEGVTDGRCAGCHEEQRPGIGEAPVLLGNGQSRGGAGRVAAAGPPRDPVSAYGEALAESLGEVSGEMGGHDQIDVAFEHVFAK